ncbi:MAG: 3-hydroxyacyl-CoA dehydrogenase NAD-binding domain-containing protein [Sphingomonadales bacterium]
MTNAIKTNLDENGNFLLTIDVPDHTMNIINQEFMSEFANLIEKIESSDAIKGVIITSGKPTFMAGADLRMMEGILRDDSMTLEDSFDTVFNLNRIFRKMETCGKPVVIAVNGTCMGGGFEMALACHHRIVADDPKIKIGLPEVLVGLLPGGGGTQRLPRLAGIQVALQYCSTGKTMSPQEVVGMDIFQEVVPKDQLIEKAREYLNGKPVSQQPWDKKGFKFPGGSGAMHPNAVQTFMGANGMAQDKSFHNYPAVQSILSCIYEGGIVPIDTALKIESKYFLNLLMGDVAKNMIRTLFVNKQDADKLRDRPEGFEKHTVKKLGMLGAGMMGAGIAYVSAKAGMEVVLLDMSQEGADKGKAYSEKLVAKGIKRRKVTKEKGQVLLDRIKTTTDFNDLKGCDLIIEAVFEDPEIKSDVTKKAEAIMPKDTIFASNTSSLPITGLAKSFSREEEFIGIHFFSPVDKMPLVEIIMGKKTGNKAKAIALDYVGQIKKTPIVVNDSRGFYTSRCFSTYVQEGYAMVKEGISPALIDNAGKHVGMPVGPLAVGDEVAIDLSYRIYKATQQALGDKYVPTPADDFVETMMKLERYGRKNAKGSYVYPEGGSQKYLWPDLSTHFPPAENQPDVEELKIRYLWRQAIEAARCFEEGVLNNAKSGDVGAIMGWGFAPWTGGPLSFIDTIGPKKFVAEADRLSQTYGPRFSPPQSLRVMADRGETYYS